MSVKNSQQLKQLTSRKSKLEVDVNHFEQERKSAQSNLDKAKNQLKSVNSEIDKLKTKDLVITEHAILRYIERAMGIDIEELKGKIIDEGTKAMIESMGNGKYPIGNGCRAIVKDMAVVSIA